MAEFFEPAMLSIISKALWQTIVMVLWSTLFSVILGLLPAIVLTLTAPDGLRPNKGVYGALSFVVNVLRSFPFIILMIIVIPLTRAIVGKAIGTTAAIVPLTISAVPFVARVMESAFREVDAGLIEAARSFGASNVQIFRRVYMKEALPGILSGIVLTMISLVGYSAMGGAIGAGGLGDVAIRYGYQGYRIPYLVVTSVVLIVFVQIVQMIGNKLYDKLK
jgi:ABC-type metal ion transport system, permease component